MEETPAFSAASRSSRSFLVLVRARWRYIDLVAVALPPAAAMEGRFTIVVVVVLVDV
ncbi:hypothetical protein MY10362_002734 [Beauveria mimosiformis]